MAVKIDKDKYTGYGKCVDVCPVEAIKIENKKAIVTEECIECGACVSQCPRGAISL